MRTPSIVRDYSRLSDLDLVGKAQSIVVSLTDNAYFPDTVPTLADLTSVKQNYSASIDNAASGSKTQIALKRQAKESMLMTLKLLGTNIESLAQGNRVKLISSGFELSADGENVPAIHAPTNFVIEDGVNVGQVKFSVRAVKNAVAYVHEYTTEPLTADSRWATHPTTLREHVFDVPSNTRIYGRVAAIGRKGQQTYSAVLTRVVQ